MTDLWTILGFTGTLASLATLALAAVLARFAWGNRLAVPAAVAAMFLFTGFALLVAGGLRGWAMAAAWLALILLGFLYAKARRVDGVVLLALGVGVLVISGWHTTVADAIRARPTEATQAAAARLRQDRLETLTTHATAMRFAEDTAADRLDLAGVSPAQRQRIEQAASENDVPLYRRGGKVARNRDNDDTNPIDSSQAPATPEMSARDARRARWAAQANRFLAQFGFVFAVTLVGLDYLRRLNRTTDALPAAPLRGRWLDALSPTTHAVHVQTGNRAVWINQYLRRTSRRGACFLLFGAQAPDDPALRWGGGLGSPGCDVEAGLHELWFGRGSWVVSERARVAVLQALLRYLRARQDTRARARRTAHVIWTTDALLDSATLAELATLCRDTNFKLVVVGDSPGPADQRACFDERILDR